MSRKTLTLCFLLLTCTCLAQRKEMKVIYYDLNWKKTGNQYKAAYYRESFLERDTLYVTDYYIGGKKQMMGQYTDRKGVIKNGFFTYYNVEGIKSSEGNIVNDKAEGKWLYWFASGELNCSGKFINGKYEGEWTDHFKSGRICRTRTYISDSLMKLREYHEDGRELNENDTFTLVEKMPEFNGSLKEFLSNKIIYPKEARENGIEGRVIIQFVIDKQGEIHHIFITSPVHPSLDEESWRVIRIMPNWIPGLHNGKPANVRVTLPIRYIIN